MSNIVITDIIGTGPYKIPTNDEELIDASSGLTKILNGVHGLSFDTVIAWVEDMSGPGDVEGDRRLHCVVSKFRYHDKECPSESEIDVMTQEIEHVLESDQNIASIEKQLISLFSSSSGLDIVLMPVRRSELPSSDKRRDPD